MPPKRNRVPDADENEPTPIWRVNPPGPEQLELNGLFKKGLIGSTDTAAKIRSRYPQFGRFPTKTFALYFRLTKAKCGLNAVSKAPSGHIPELDGTDGTMEEPRPPSVSPFAFIESQLETRNYPYMVWTYADHEIQKDRVCVAVPTVSGSRDINFVISDDGMKLSIDFVWPSSLLNPNELFFDVTDDEDGTAISMSHPKVYSFRNHLVECDLSERSMPRASLVVDLPIKVQRDVGTYTKRALKCGESRIAMLEFTAFQKKTVLRDADNSIRF